MDSLSEAGQALATYQIDYDEEVGHAACAASTTWPATPMSGPSSWWRRSSTPTTPTWPARSGGTCTTTRSSTCPNRSPKTRWTPTTRRIRRGIEADTIGYTTDQCRNARHGYYANTSYFDSWIGRLVRVLEETGRLDSTVVIVTSDHGDMLGDRGTFFKMSFFERSAGASDHGRTGDRQPRGPPTSARTSTCYPRCSTSQPVVAPGPTSAHRSRGQPLAARGRRRRRHRRDHR